MAVALRAARRALRVAGLCVLLARAHGFGGDTMDVDRATSWLETMHASDSGPDPNTVNWRRCASEGELCDCSYQKSAVRLIRYGSPAESETGDRKWQWDYAHVEATADVLLCHPLSFMHRDPAPGFVKHCECAHARDESVPPAPPEVFDRVAEVVIPANRTQIGAPPPPPEPGVPPAPPPAPRERAYAAPASPESALDALAAMAPESRAGAPVEVSAEMLTDAMDAMAREEMAEAREARATAAAVREMAPRFAAAADELDAMAPGLAERELEMRVVSSEMAVMSSETGTTASTVDDMAREMEALAPEMSALEVGTRANATAKNATAPEVDALAARAEWAASEAAWVASETRAMRPDMEALASEAAAIADGSEMRAVVTEVQSMARDAAAVDANATRSASDAKRAAEDAEAVAEILARATISNGTRDAATASATPPARTSFVAPKTHALNPNDYAWRFCARAGSNETCECATPGALVRFGSTGEPEYYAPNSTWFADHPFVRKFDYASLRPGATKTICDARMFLGSDPFPDHDKVCHCADRGAIPEDQPLVTFLRENVRPSPPSDESDVAGENAATEPASADSVVAAVARAGKQPRAADVFKLPPIRDRGARGSTGDESDRASLGRSAVRQRDARVAETFAEPAAAAAAAAAAVAAAAAAALAARRARRLRGEARAERVALCARGNAFVLYGDDATV